MSSAPPADHRGAIEALIRRAGIADNADLVAEIIETALALGVDPADRVDLKITRSAVAEMRDAFRTFAPYASVPKVTVFGSARTASSDPLYRQAVDAAQRFATAGWMVVTGAGPGIMHAATEGAGAERSIGVSIRLPFESGANALLDGDAKHVAMKYFFTRKLMLVKESAGFICLPGGFGTLDETLELLTLQQTGKTEPAPIVLLDVPGGTFWSSFLHVVDEELIGRGYVTDGDLDRVLHTDSADAAFGHITGFYRNFHSLRWEDDLLIIRLRTDLDAAQLAVVRDRFRAHLHDDVVTLGEATAAERADDDVVDLPRLMLRWDPHAVGELHRLIDVCNRFVDP